jgi:sortase A
MLQSNTADVSPAAATGKLRSARARWRLDWLKLLAALIVLAGLLLFTYPSAASWFSQYNQSLLVDTYSNRVNEGDLDPSAAEQLILAHKYNDALTSGAILGANERLPTGAGTTTDDSLDYWSMLKTPPLGIMARLRIPVINVDLPVYHGTADDTLEMGVGHLQGTSLPVGGADTHSVLTAHRGLANATMFTNLDKVSVGDRFTIEVMSEVLTYEVVRTQVVNPDEQDALRPVAGEDLVTLVTCTPLGINTQRILVTGTRVTPTPIKDLESRGAPSVALTFPWWAVAIGVGTLLVVGYVWRSGYPPRRR